MSTLLTIDEAAAALHVSVDTLRYWRAHRTGPRSAKLGRRVMYRQEDIAQWVSDQFAIDKSRTPAA